MADSISRWASVTRSRPPKVSAITGAREPSRSPEPMRPAARRRPSSVAASTPLAYVWTVCGQFLDRATGRGSSHPYSTAVPPGPAVAEALRALHGDPAKAWTVEELGALGGLSRAAFARRSTALVGRAPLAYLPWWRMTTAGRLLRSRDLPLRAVAQRAGYTSEFAFAKAFKREYGVAPGQYRKGA